MKRTRTARWSHRHRAAAPQLPPRPRPRTVPPHSASARQHPPAQPPLPPLHAEHNCFRSVPRLRRPAAHHGFPHHTAGCAQGGKCYSRLGAHTNGQEDKAHRRPARQVVLHKEALLQGQGTPLAGRPPAPPKPVPVRRALPGKVLFAAAAACACNVLQASQACLCNCPCPPCCIQRGRTGNVHPHDQCHAHTGDASCRAAAPEVLTPWLLLLPLAAQKCTPTVLHPEILFWDPRQKLARKQNLAEQQPEQAPPSRTVGRPGAAAAAGPPRRPRSAPSQGAGARCCGPLSAAGSPAGCLHAARAHKMLRMAATVQMSRHRPHTII